MRGAVIVTGATGFLGGHLLAALLARGGRVLVLGRPREGRGLSQRIAALLAWFGLASRQDHVETVEVDLRRPRCGLSDEQYRAVCSEAGPIIHCASDTRFSERRRQEVTDTNLHGLARILDLAVDSRTPFFHYVSTAYVGSGTAPTPCREQPVDRTEFVNVYEETKVLAEREVAARCQRERLAYSIIRPSIVYGDSRTGRSTRFNALYYPVRSLAALRDIYLNDLRKGGGRARALGIGLGADGVLHLPLRVFVARCGRLNLVPIDYFVAAVERILERAEAGGIYHLTSGSPVALTELAGYCQSFLQLSGLEVVEGTPDAGSLNPAEALFQKLVSAYLPYLADQRCFDRSRANRAIRGLQPPDFSYQIFERCMSYAAGVNWREEDW